MKVNHNELSDTHVGIISALVDAFRRHLFVNVRIQSSDLPNMDRSI